MEDFQICSKVPMKANYECKSSMHLLGK
jgi:hypothetical protein